VQQGSVDVNIRKSGNPVNNTQGVANTLWAAIVFSVLLAPGEEV
jgi:hypothetical protein